jgi:PPM family protein phosphatase
VARAGRGDRHEEDVGVELWTIGAFARAAGLTPKALRLYDQSGLLRPAAVDPDSGYRLYDPVQLRHARLVAELRRIGMPLAEIRTVCGLGPPEAAGAVAAYWAGVSADTAQRARLAALLVEHLSGRDATMSNPNSALDIRFAARCDAGAVRATNEDAAYASAELLAVADGGGGPAGAQASAAAIDALNGLESAGVTAAELLTMLAGVVTEVDHAIRKAATGDSQPISTLTALLRRGSHLALVHIGDSRAYLLRAGELFQLTQDHTWVQAQVDAGKLNPEQAAAHPQRALLVRALGAGGTEVEADLALRVALPGDRYLLCSDGVSAVIGRAALYEALSATGDPDQIVDRLIDLVRDAGAPDNMACVVADFVSA